MDYVVHLDFLYIFYYYDYFYVDIDFYDVVNSSVFLDIFYKELDSNNISH